jgi:hypothetical protein
MSAGIVTMSSPRQQSARRVAALARAEGVLLRRSRIALLTALALPIAMVYTLKASGVLGAGGSRGAGAALLTELTVFALLLPVYYNLVTAMARREELVLKRLRTGEATDANILAGTAACRRDRLGPGRRSRDRRGRHIRHGRARQHRARAGRACTRDRGVRAAGRGQHRGLAATLTCAGCIPAVDEEAGPAAEGQSRPHIDPIKLTRCSALAP